MRRTADSVWQRLRIAGPVALVSAAVLISLAPWAAASSSPSVSSAPGVVLWAYGAARSVNASGTAADGNTTYAIHGFYGWNTVLTQRNESATNFQLEVNRTVGASLFVNYCRPDCSSPSRSLNITERAWETQLAFANFTTAGTVNTSSGPAPALAILNSTVSEKGKLSEAAEGRVTTLRGTIATASESLSIFSFGRTSVSFQPPLGLFPTAGNATSWSAASSYSASGSWTVTLSTQVTTFYGVTNSASQSFPGSFTGLSGTIELNGSTGAGTRLTNGAAVAPVTLTLNGPFTSWEGFILVPNAADLFAENSASWRGEPAGGQIASTQTVDVATAGSVGHFPFLASSTRYLASSTDAGTVSLDSGVGSSVASTPLPPPAGSANGSEVDGPAPLTIQAEPEPTGVAQGNSQCLITGCLSNSTGGVLRGVVVLLVVVAAAAVIGLTVVKRQPPRRAPPSPNARLYPQGSAANSPSAPATGFPTGESVEDPLAHLW